MKNSHFPQQDFSSKTHSLPRVQVGRYEHSCQLGGQAAIQECVGAMVLVPFIGPIYGGIRCVESTDDYCCDKCSDVAMACGRWKERKEGTLEKDFMGSTVGGGAGPSNVCGLWRSWSCAWSTGSVQPGPGLSCMPVTLTNTSIHSASGHDSS